MYHHDSYPWKAIGPVTFMWNPSQPIKTQDTNEPPSERQLWIWCHPACWAEVWEELIKSFDLEEKMVGKQQNKGISVEKNCRNENNNNKSIEKPEVKENANDEKKTENNADMKEQVSTSNNNKKVKSGLLKGKYAAKVKVENVDKSAIKDKFKTDVVATDIGNKVQMRSLSGSILRFRLTGPESVTVLVDTFQRATVAPSDVTTNGEKWWASYYKTETLVKAFETQSQFMDRVGECMSPAELPSRCIFAVTARDPRITRPAKRTKIETDDTSMTLCDVFIYTVKTFIFVQHSFHDFVKLLGHMSTKIYAHSSNVAYITCKQEFKCLCKCL